MSLRNPKPCRAAFSLGTPAVHAHQYPFRVSGPCRKRPTYRAVIRQAVDANDDATIVVALGGNALLKRGEELTIDNQRRNVVDAASAIARIVASSFRCCVTHGNGPQVGLLAAQDEASGLDVLDAESEGQIGYLIALEIGNQLSSTMIEAEVATLLTQVVVDPDDPAFRKPTKPIGRWYTSEEEARAAVATSSRTTAVVARDKDSWRRVVASPKPLRIVESRSIKLLLDAGVVVVCCGGGGIPVVEEEDVGTSTSTRRGVEAVVDKDLASALLASELDASHLLILTDAPAVYDPRHWPDAEVPLPSPVSLSTLKMLLNEHKFAAGSMGPKMEAAAMFIEATKGRGRVGVGRIEDAEAILCGTAGTLIVDDF